MPMDKVILSDSDTDSDVLFENRHGKTNGTKSSRNGYKSDRRIKTWLALFWNVLKYWVV